MSRCLPIIHSLETIPESPSIAQRLDLEFSNGQRRTYWRRVSESMGSVVIIPLLDAHTVLLVREYATGFHRYELGLVKGRVEQGEDVLHAANRELKEEVGYGAHQLDILRTVTLMPAYMTSFSHIVLARDLYPEAAKGDEPEPLERVPWEIARLHELAFCEEFSEGRSLAALWIVQQWLREHG